MKPLAQNTSTMKESGIRRLMHKSADVPKAIHLETGQPDFITPSHIIEAACEAMKKGYTGYTPSAGYASLREIIADKAVRINKIKASADNVVVTVGGVSGITTTLFASIDQGDEVLIPNPHDEPTKVHEKWPTHHRPVKLIGGSRPIPV